MQGRTRSEETSCKDQRHVEGAMERAAAEEGRASAAEPDAAKAAATETIPRETEKERDT